MSLLQLKSYLQHRNKEKYLLILIISIGLLIRLYLIFTIEEPIDKDAAQYYNIANNILAKNMCSIDGIHPTAVRSPGYPLIIAMVISIAGKNVNTIYVFQALINLATIILVYLSLKRAGVSSVHRVTTIVIFTFSTSFVYVNVLYAEITAMFFVSLIIYSNIDQRLKKIPVTKSIIIGVLTGSLIYIRPTFLYFPFFLLINIPFTKHLFRKSRTKELLITAITAVMIVAPWTIRNNLIFQKWIPLVSLGGCALWQANVEISERTVWYSVTDIQKYEAQRTYSANLQNELINNYRKKYKISGQEELNSFLFRKGIQNIINHPLRYMLLSFNRFLIFWFSPPIGATTLKSIHPIIFILALLFKYLLTILAIWGLYRMAHHNWEQYSLLILMVLYLTLLHSLGHAIQRYFLPVVPVFYFSLGFLLNHINFYCARKRLEI